MNDIYVLNIISKGSIMATNASQYSRMQASQVAQ